MLGCFLIWGFQPLYFSLCGEIDTFFLMASRVIWAAICVVILLKLQGKLPQLKVAFRDKALLRREIPAALLMGGDWVVYLWAIQRGKVLECSMAYYIQPLVVFMFGALIYKEKVSWRHIVILAIVIVGIARSSTGFGGVPYVTIVLSLLFAVYAAIKKSIQIDSIVSTSIEILILMPLAILYILFFRTGADGLGALTVVRQLLLCGAGVVTAGTDAVLRHRCAQPAAHDRRHLPVPQPDARACVRAHPRRDALGGQARELRFHLGGRAAVCAQLRL